MTAAAGRVRRELRRTASRLDGSADGGVTLLVQFAHTGVPVVSRFGVIREKRSRPACIAPRDLDVLLERCVAELGEPEAMLLDEVDGESVSPRRNRRAQREALL